MEFVSANSFFSKSSNLGGRAPVGDKVVFSILKNNKKPKDKAFTLCIRLPQTVAKKARFMAGDRIDVLFHVTSRLVLVKRVRDGRWSFYGDGKSLTTSLSYRSGMPSVSQATPCEYTITDEGLVFELPETASFERNLRESS